jgi:hypothetical protein
MIAMANTTAVLFDHTTEMIKPVTYDGTLEDLLDILKVNCIDTIRLDREHIIIVDDEGFVNRIESGFGVEYKGRRVEFAGSGLLTGDSYGSNAPITLNLADLKIDVLKFKYEPEES